MTTLPKGHWHSPEMDAWLTQMWTEPDADLGRLLSAREIAERIVGITKNQVVRRVRTLRLPIRGSPMSPETREKQKAAMALRRQKIADGTYNAPGWVATSGYATPANVIVANGQPVWRRTTPKKAPAMPRLYGRVTKCAAIVGTFVSLEDDGTCGEPTVPGKSYCHAHHTAFTSPIGPLRPQKWMR